MNLNVDFNQVTGKIKAMHAVGQPPMPYLDTSYMHYLSEAHIPYSRLHDVGGWWGGNMFVDIPNLFRDFDADPEDPASYDFTFTDILMKALMEQNCKPYFRLGVTIENFHRSKAYRVYPPKDFEKWARICEHVVRHYNEGWADGYHYNIRYWEVWNEPDDAAEDYNQSSMWKGTWQQYFDLYRITAKRLKACFGNTIKVGGYACTGLYQWFLGGEALFHKENRTPSEERQVLRTKFFRDFLTMVRDGKVPFDFFSIHSYQSVENTLLMQDFVEQELERYGFGDVEIHLNEWNVCYQREDRGSSRAAAHTAAMMCAMQNRKMHLMCYYDAQIGISQYGGLFDPSSMKPVSTYYSLKAFGELYMLGNQVSCQWEQPGVYAVAAAGEAGKAVMLTNVSDSAVEVECGAAKGMTVYLVDDAHMLESVDWNPANFTLEVNQTVLLK